MHYFSFLTLIYVMDHEVGYYSDLLYVIKYAILQDGPTSDHAVVHKYVICVLSDVVCCIIVSLLRFAESP